jgi:hypothetical protein
MSVSEDKSPVEVRMPVDQGPFSRTVEGILDILVSIDEETVVKWIRAKYPIGLWY